MPGLDETRAFVPLGIAVALMLTKTGRKDALELVKVPVGFLLSLLSFLCDAAMRMTETIGVPLGLVLQTLYGDDITTRFGNVVSAVGNVFTTLGQLFADDGDTARPRAAVS